MLLGFGELCFIEKCESIGLSEFRERFIPDAPFDSAYRNMETLVQMGILKKYTDLATRSIGFTVDDIDQLAERILELSTNLDLDTATTVIDAVKTAIEDSDDVQPAPLGAASS
jgi:hypothetical protein